MNPVKKPVNKNPALTNVPLPYCSPTFPCALWKQLSHISCVGLSGFTGRKSYLISLVCKTMRDLHLLRLGSYHWGLHFPFFFLVNGNLDTSIPQRLLRFFLWCFVCLSIMCEASKIRSKSAPSLKLLQELKEMLQCFSVFIGLI